jgi:8-oxo-dGTP pyrophosphatase MutT (NUDIX family)
MSKIRAKVGQLIYTITIPARRLYKSDKVRSYGIIEHQEKVLIIKNWIGSGVWSLPGGGSQPGETPVEALKRELNEETGLVIEETSVELIAEGVHTREFGKKRFALFHVPYKNKPSVVINYLEIVEHRWIEKHKLHELHPVSHELNRAKQIITNR